MPDNPALPVNGMNRMRAPAGQDAICLESPLCFETDEIRQSTLDALNGADGATGALHGTESIASGVDLVEVDFGQVVVGWRYVSLVLVSTDTTPEVLFLGPCFAETTSGFSVLLSNITPNAHFSLKWSIVY